MVNIPKAIAMYLPQFHDVDENNMWWGEGYTDWRAMECAEPMYEGHQQPKQPLNNYKYDLLQKETMQWQANLMKKHDVYGMCFYHYWFKDGRKILERPAENLLKWTDIDMPFCFCWANESWICSWSKISYANVWTGKFEVKVQDESGNGVLLEQDYGQEKQWKEHFSYLLPFFQDERYIKKENKPVFIVYKATIVPCLKEMLQMWNVWAKEAGFAGMYIIGANLKGEELEILDAELMHEPSATIQRDFYNTFANKERMEVARYLSYEKVCSASLNYSMQKEQKVYWGGFVNYDDTPRHGSAGTVIFNGNPEKFKLYLTEVYAKNAAEGNEFIFVNAWNEWGEGMYLEPDESHGEGYLEAFRYAAEHCLEEMYKYQDKQAVPQNDELEKLKAEKNRFYNDVALFDKWLAKKEQNKNLSDYFKSRNIKTIAIYGFGIIGKHLLNEIDNSDGAVKCSYIIDRGAKVMKTDVPIFEPGEELEEVDLIVVSTIHIYEEIYELLSSKGSYKIMSLRQVIEEW